jgi:protein disulfide-isomerase
MHIEIWSDIHCPFCYLGKRRLEAALESWSGKEPVQIEWKSFQLNPDQQRVPGRTVHQYLAEKYGMSLAKAQETHARMTETGRGEGIEFDFDNLVLSNSFLAHRLLHYAKSKNLGNALKEILFRRHFSEGEDVGEKSVLISTAVEAGLKAEETEALLNSDQFKAEVHADIEEAMRLGIRGVPFFLFDRKFAVSGAQGVDVFLGALNKAEAG